MYAVQRISKAPATLARLAMNVARRSLAWGLCLWAAASFTAAAAATDPLVDQRVRAFLHQHTQDLGRDIKITLHHSTARLPRCENPQPFLTNPEQRLYGRLSVGIRCGKQGTQVRYLQADVSVVVDHVVAARDLRAGERIRDDDLRLAEAQLERLPRHALLTLDEATGLLAARPLPAGTTLQAHHLRREALVKRGASVTVTARGTGFSVTREAKALDSGSLGDRIRLATQGGEQLSARVTGRNRLEIAF